MDGWAAPELVSLVQGVQQVPPPWLLRLAEEERQQGGANSGAPQARRPSAPGVASSRGWPSLQGGWRAGERLAADLDLDRGGADLKGGSHVQGCASGVQPPARPTGSALVMSSGDWCDAAFDAGSSGGDGGLAAHEHVGVEGASSSDTEDAGKAGGGGAQRDWLAAVEARQQRKADAFNRYVSTWWGAGQRLASVLGPSQQQLLQRQLQRRQQRQQRWQQQAEGEAGDEGGSAGAAAGGGADVSDEQLVHQWYEIVKKGLAR